MRILVVVLTLLGAACGSVNAIDDTGVDAAPNTAPVISSLTVDSTNPADEINVACAATDTDGDALTFSYTASAGTVSGTTGDVVWEPLAEGDNTITCTVDDGRGGSDSMEITETMRVDAGIVTLFRFANDVTDSLGNITDIDPGGTPVFVDDRFGNAAGAASFDGQFQIFLGNETVLDLPSFTISAWVAVTPSNTRRPIISKSAAQDNGAFHLEIADDSNPTLGGRMHYTHVTATGAVFEGGGSLAEVPTGQFIHLAVTLDATQVTGYVNGVMQQQAPAPAPQLNDAGTVIGGSAFGSFIGTIDEVRVYNRALSEGEVASLANSTIP